MEHTIREEIREGNYVVTKSKPIIVSAIGAVPKPDSDEFGLIHDCSMPKGKGVNSYAPHIDKLCFQSIDDAIKLIDKGYYLAKIDLRHAYRSVPIYPSNYAATGLKWPFEGDSVPTYFVDTRLPFGGRRAPGIFHHLSQSVRCVMLRWGFHSIVVYLDDFLIIGRTKEECQHAFDTLMQLLLDLGFQISPSKVVPPCQQLVFLGVQFDTINLELSLPQTTLEETREVTVQLSVSYNS